MSKRNINLDIIRCVAVFFVLSVHFFLNNGFYDEIVIGKKMYVASIMRQCFMVCVPLFIVLTGYLMNKKQLTAQYFKGIKKVLVIYILSTLCICVYKMAFLKEPMSVLDVVFNITSYQQYSWYIEMYMGLYLLIPFLNILYHGLKEKREKGILILVLMILTMLPSALNTFDSSIIPVADPQIMPEWWNGIYPLLYYYIGAYLCEYGVSVKLSLHANFILAVFAIVTFGTYSYLRSYGTTFVWGQWCAYNGFTNVIDAVLVFVFFLRVNVNMCPQVVKKILTKISEVSLSIYLVSWIFDNYAYRILNTEVEHMRNRIAYFLIIVLFVFACSFGLACVVDYVYKIGKKELKVLLNLFQRKNKE